MNRKIQKIYDVLLKIIISIYLGEFLKYIGETRKIDKILQTEIQTLKGKTKFLDFLCRLEDGSLCHIEFQFPVAYSKDLNRFYKYNITAEVKYDETANTIIFNFSTSSKGKSKIPVGECKSYFSKTFYLGDIDFEKILENIHIMLNLNRLESIIYPDTPNIQLTYTEELHILLMSLAEKYTNKEVLLKQIVELLKNEEIFHEEKIGPIKSIIRVEIENFVEKSKCEKLL